MTARCENEDREDYKNYGARGITVCGRWRDSFEAFLADMGSKPGGLTLERIDNERGYEPGNCRWASRRDQRRNSRRIQYVEHDGLTMILKDAAAAIGVTDPAIYQDRKRHGGDIQSAFDRVRARH